MQDEPISKLMEACVQTIGADDTVQTVEAFLTAHHLHWAPVVGDGGELLGVISDVDLVRFHLEARDPLATAAWQLCTYKPLTVSPGATVSEVARLMVAHRIHHVVVAEGHALCGVVSSLDLVKALA